LDKTLASQSIYPWIEPQWTVMTGLFYVPMLCRDLGLSSPPSTLPVIVSNKLTDDDTGSGSAANQHLDFPKF